MNSRQRMWWTDNPDNPDVTTADDPDVQRLVDKLAPETAVSELGGCMSLNLRLHTPNVVLRVQQPFISKARVLALQELRLQVLRQGVLAAEPVGLHRCRRRWAETEKYIEHTKPEATWDSYLWMYHSMGRLHRALATVDVKVPRPVVSTYAPPSTLRRWLAATAHEVRYNHEATEFVLHAKDLVRRLRSTWVPSNALPEQVIHGDIRLGNVGLTPGDETVYLDFGFAAVRPRIHDLAYSLVWIVFRPDGKGTGADFDWDSVPELLAAYEEGAQTALTDAERAALLPYLATVPLYQVAIVGYSADPVAMLWRDGRPKFLRISEYVLTSGLL